MALALLVFVPFMLFHILRFRSNMLKAERKVKERSAEINAENENHKSSRKFYYPSMAFFQSLLDFLLV
jgi:hypothetical protein